jgi:hypothetical protein
MLQRTRQVELDADSRSWREMDAGKRGIMARDQHRQSQWADRQILGKTQSCLKRQKF